MLITMNILTGWLIYEIGVGIQAIGNQTFRTGKKWGYVPPTLLFARDRQDYFEWKEWKGDRFE